MEAYIYIYVFVGRCVSMYSGEHAEKTGVSAGTKNEERYHAGTYTHSTHVINCGCSVDLLITHDM